MALAIIGQPAEEPVPLHRPLIESRVPCGFPSPAQDYVEHSLDLNDLLVHRPVSTYYLRSHGESMREAGINDNAILVVDRSLEAQDQDIVVAIVDGELTCKRLQMSPPALVADNPDYPAISIPESGCTIWGVVTAVINQFQRR